MNVVVENRPDQAIICLSGELDVANIAEADAVIFHDQITGQAVVTLDVSGLTFCDSSGLRLFLRVRRAVLDAGGSFAVTGATGAVARSIEVTGLADVLRGREA